MLRVWSRIKAFQSGFSPVEVLLAATVFAFLTTALIGAIIYGRSSTANAGDRVRAVQLADEGIEAVRNIRDASFTNLPSAAGTYGLSQVSNQWTLVAGFDQVDIFKREISFSAIDASRKTVTVTVSWPQGNSTATVSSTSRLTNWLAAIVSPAPTTGPIMMAYSKTTTTPFYRIWNGTAWSAEAAAANVVGNINYVVLKSSRTRNEAIMGVQTSTGAIYVQVWNGTAWGNLTQVGTGPATTRSFDIAYEKSGDRAVVAYSPSSGSADFAYRTWNGTTLSAATTITAPPTTGAINWMEMKQNPLSTSNEIAMIMLDANADVYGMAWNGTTNTWSTMGAAAVWDATAASAAKKTIDVDYEQTSGRAMFMWGDSVATDQYYRTWNGTTLSAATLLDIPAAGGLSEWVQLAARPNSNEIMVGVQDAGADLNTRKWSGSTWDTAAQHPEHDAGVENVLSRNFDIVWETHSTNLGKAWLVWGDGATRSERQWSGTAWSTATVASGSDDTSFVRLRADPVSGAVFSGIYQCACSAGNNRDINERHLINGGSTWSGSNQLWGGPTTVDPVHFRVDIATP